MGLVPNATEQRTDRSRLGTLVILFVVAAIGVGLWFALERPKLAEPASDAKPPAGDAQTTVSGTDSAAGDAQTTVSGATSSTGDAQTTASGADSAGDDAQTTASGADSADDDPQSTLADTDSATGDAQTAVSGATSSTDDPQSTLADADSAAGDAQTAASGATSSTDDPQSTLAGADSSTGDAQTTASGTDSAAGDPQSTLAGADSSTGDAQTTASGKDSAAGDPQSTLAGADSAAGDAQTAVSGATSSTDDPQSTLAGSTTSPASDLPTAGIGTGASQDPIPSADPDATDDATRIAAVGPGTAPVDEAPRVSAAPESAIAKTPVDAPPETETTGETGILAAVGDAIERLQTAIEERLDSELEVSITYDDSQADAPRDEVVPAETTRTADTDAPPTADGALIPDSGAGDDTAIAGSDGAAPSDTIVAAETTADDEAPRLPAASESTFAKTPADAPPETEATGETGILAAAGDSIERPLTAIEERIDSELPVRMTDDGSQADAPRAEVAPAETTRTTDTDAPPTPDDALVPDTDAGDDASIAGSAGAGGAAPSDAVVAADTTAVDETPRVSAAPESTIAKTPADAPPETEATGETGETGILAAAGGAIERLQAAVEELLDSELEVSIKYDDSQAAAPRDEAAPAETTRTADTDAPPTPDDTPVPDSDAGDDASVAGSAGSGGAAPSDTTMAADTTAADTTAADAAAVDATTVADATAKDATSAADTTATDATTAATGPAEAEAKKYVETLTDTAPQTIPVDKADHFVTQERVISLVPDDTIENVSVDELAGDETLSPDTPITVVREVEQVENAVAEQLIADSGGNLDEELRVQVTYDDTQEHTGTVVVEEDDVERITVREALDRIRTEPDKPLPVIRTVRYFEVVTLKELLDGAESEDAFLNVVTRPYRIESATLADLLQRQRTENPDAIFYLHTVLPTDDQGIWGIVHFGIIENFARGIAIRRGEDIETYTVRIPRHADERLADRSSSFLGLMIDRKTKDSYVYNFRENRMGRNPDRIFPGQELVIINFQPEELMSIYRHFAAS